MLTEMAIRGLVVPALAAVTVLGGAWAVGRWVGRSSLLPRSVPLATAAGYLAGQVALIGWPSFPPLNATEWLAYLVVAGGLWGLVEASQSRRQALRRAGSAALSLAAAAVLLRPLLGTTWQPMTGWIWIGLVGLGILAFWRALGLWVERAKGMWLPLTLTVWLAGIAVVLALSGSLLLGQLGGVLVSAFVAVLAVEHAISARLVGRESLAPLALLLSGLLLAGLFYADVPLFSLVSLLLAPVAVWAVQSVAVRLRKRWVQRVLLGGSVMLLVAVAVWIAAAASPAGAWAP